MNVELGAGRRKRAGFIGVDVNPKHANVVADALSLPFRTATVHELVAIDVLEHISYRDTDQALNEWARVLMHGGSLYVQVPDAEEIMVRYCRAEAEQLRTPAGLPDSLLAGVTWRLLGGHADGLFVDEGDDWRWNAHYSLWSRRELGAALERAGFDVVRIRTNAHPNLQAEAVRQ